MLQLGVVQCYQTCAGTLKPCSHSTRFALWRLPNLAQQHKQGRFSNWVTQDKESLAAQYVQHLCMSYPTRIDWCRHFCRQFLLATDASLRQSGYNYDFVFA